MIIIKIWGGLGNQMFQFALAKALSHGNDVKLKMDISGKTPFNVTLRPYRLAIFRNIEQEFADKIEIKKIVPQFSFDLLNKLYKNINKRIWRFNKSYFVETKLSYTGIILPKEKSIYLDGYWQSERYFDKYADLIKDCFNLDYLRGNMSLQPTIERIESENSVSIHVRRGDYVTNSIANSFHGVIDSKYYETSITKMIEATSKDLTFYIFSDDIEWCKKYLTLPLKHYFITSGEDYHDLFLMSICKHNIIANSSFSWWAAWLNRHTEKIVIAPENWFLKKVAMDIVPAGWIKN